MSPVESSTFFAKVSMRLAVNVNLELLAMRLRLIERSVNRLLANHGLIQWFQLDNFRIDLWGFRFD